MRKLMLVSVFFSLFCSQAMANEGNTQKDPPPSAWPQSCSEIPENGTCLKGARVYCDNNEVKTEVCADSDKACRTDANGAASCEFVDCNGIDNFGVCNEDTKIVAKCTTMRHLVETYCVNGCNNGLNDTFGAYCISSLSCEEAHLDFSGACDDNVLSYCSEDNNIVSGDCSKNGGQCAITENVGADCVYPSCNGNNTDGMCDADGIYMICNTEEDAMYRFNCKELYGENYVCGQMSTNKIGCIYKVPCGDVPAEGQCDGNVLSYCDANNGLVVEDCAAKSQICAHFDGNDDVTAGYYCQDENEGGEGGEGGDDGNDNIAGNGGDDGGDDNIAGSGGDGDDTGSTDVSGDDDDDDDDIAPAPQTDAGVGEEENGKGSSSDDGCSSVPGRSNGFLGLLPLFGLLALRRRK